MAAIIASQALISGAFSLTRQAIQLGYCPRLEIEHTSASHQGQIYMPQVNWALMVATIGLVLGFRSSSALAAAYGIAVTSTMVITTMLAYLVARGSWGVSRAVAGSLAGVLPGDRARVLRREPDEDPRTAAGSRSSSARSSTRRSRRGSAAARCSRRACASGCIRSISFSRTSRRNPPTRVPGTAIFMTSNLVGTPPTLLHNLEHNKVLHDRIILLTVVTNDVPHVPVEERGRSHAARSGILPPDAALRVHGGTRRPGGARRSVGTGIRRSTSTQTTFFLGVETLLATRRPGMPLWRERLFVWIARNAVRANTFFKIPPERVVELGMQVEL